MSSLPLSRSGERGFTLVELAIVLVIIGLLITGLLKGAELISNARVKATIGQIRSLDAATTTFRDNYRFLPGDLPNVRTRLPNCAAGTPCGESEANAGTTTRGDGRINQAAVNTAAGAAFADENKGFFQHLAVADLISGININAGATSSYGDGLLETSLGRSGYGMGYHAGGVLPAQTGAVAAVPGHYLSSRSSSADAVGANSQLRPLDVQQMDLKLDDGAPNSGTLRGAGATCANGVLYDTANTAAVCDFYAKIQN